MLPPSGRASARGHVEALLRSDLSDGVYLFNTEFPSLKQGAVRYGCSPATLRRALGQLVRDGALVRHGRRFAVPGLSREQGNGQLVLVARGAPDGSLEYVLARQRKYLITLERECSLMGIVLRFLPCFYPSGTTMKIDADSFRAFRTDTRSPTLGCMIWADGLTPELVSEQAMQFAAEGIPVAILSEDGADAVSSVVARRNVRLYRLDTGFGAGVLLGRYLARLHHRRVVYIPSLDDAEWSRQRGVGLAAGIRAVAGDAEVIALTPSQRALSMTGDPALVVASAMAPGWAEFKRVAGMTLWGSYRDRLHADIAQEAARERALAAYWPAMREACRDDTITAWVGANDNLASGALSLLASKGIAVPGTVSVAGFDDAMLATERRMTTVSLGGESAMRRMIGYLVRPTTGRRGNASGIEMVEGLVRERATTAPARMCSR